jgi:hypothetical protein
MRTMFKGTIMCIIYFLLIVANVRELFAISREREERWEAKQVAARLYLNSKAFERWVEESPDGELIEHQLFLAMRAGNFLWVLREGGHYIERDSFAEYTTDRELSFDEGMAMLWQKRAQIDATPEWSE